MIPHFLRKKMWRYNHGNRKVFQSRLSSDILFALYPDKEMTAYDLCQQLAGMPRPCLKTAISRLKEKDLVTSLDSTRHSKYVLTDLGRWTVISGRLGLSFLELCILASACCVQTRYARSERTGFYMRSHFEDILGQYYSKKSLDNAFCELNSKGLASRYVKKAMQVRPCVRDILMSIYGTYFEGLESWLDCLKRNELEIFSSVLGGIEPDNLQEKDTGF